MAKLIYDTHANPGIQFCNRNTDIIPVLFQLNDLSDGLETLFLSIIQIPLIFNSP